MSQWDLKSWYVITHFLEDSRLKGCGASRATCFENGAAAVLFLELSYLVGL